MKGGVQKVQRSMTSFKKGTPAVFIGENAFQGSSRVIQRKIEEAVRASLRAEIPSPMSRLCFHIGLLHLILSYGTGAFFVEKITRKITFKDAKRLDIEYWKSCTPEEKLDILQYLRDLYYDFKNENRKRFQRIYRIVKRT